MKTIHEGTRNNAKSQELARSFSRDFVLFRVISRIVSLIHPPARVWIQYQLLIAVVITAAAGGAEAKPRLQRARIEINTRGYQPASLRLRRGVPARVTILRTTDATCAKEIVLPDFNIRRALPLNQPVVVSFTPKTRRTFTFICGMKMLSGTLIVH